MKSLSFLTIQHIYVALTLNSEEHPIVLFLCFPRKKTYSDNISSDDEAPETPPLKKRKNADKESVPPAPKPPTLPKRTKKKGNGK